MDIHTLKKLETNATKSSQSDFLKMGIALVFILGVLWYAFGAQNVTNNAFLAIAAVFGAYMALNIGANDVANNVGPAVGSKALTMGGAIVIASIFEASGALIAGGDVVSTIKKGIIDPALFVNTQEFIWAMTAALLAGGVWLNVATKVGAPVSTTHSIVGGVMGGGIAAAGFSIVSWGTMGKIAASWIISPVLGAIIAAGFLYTIKKSIIYKEDRLAAMNKMVPIYVSIMAFAFATYLTLKGLKKIWPSILETVNAITPFTLEIVKKPSLFAALGIGLVTAILTYLVVKPMVQKASSKLKNTAKDANSLFTVPLIFAAALLSFAHGANDVANAIGPLAAVADAIQSSAISSKASIPLWVMLIGAIGISLGLALYGPKLIRTVGSEITELNQIRAYSVAMAAAITVIIASQLGLPVSSTHIAIGGIFGVGFLREFLSTTSAQERIEAEEVQLCEDIKIKAEHKTELKGLKAHDQKSEDEKTRIKELKSTIKEEKEVIKSEKKHLKRAKKIKYVQRSAVMKIIAAWIITVPTAALLSAFFFYVIKTIMT
ncbi:inorganic phosphate transporter [Sulfurimonas sp. MAG313]|nr:inorganic phosphate transporter [Sulfurimonas sp. MAG313]MDF1879720.1 inorganic phosphate transporter [Sulfurimonas sp. MAG313]